MDPGRKDPRRPKGKAGKEKGSEKPPRPWALLPLLVLATAAWVVMAIMNVLDSSYPIAWVGAVLLAGVTFLEALHSHKLSRLEAEAGEGLFLVMDDSKVHGKEKKPPSAVRIVGKMPRK